MTPAAITQFIAANFAGVDVVRPEETGGPEIAWGDVFFIYDPQRNVDPAQRFLPFATIVTKDYSDFDCAWNLNRPDVYRLNISLRKATFQKQFPDADRVHDFTTLDTLMPHPVYAVQFWVCALNPSEATFDSLQPLLAEAYELAVSRVARVA